MPGRNFALDFIIIHLFELCKARQLINYVEKKSLMNLGSKIVFPKQYTYKYLPSIIINLKKMHQRRWGFSRKKNGNRKKTES